MKWRISNRGDQEARVIADRHYNRQKIGTPQFVPPGRCCVFVMEGAFWVTSWPYGEYVKHAWPGAWVCSAFRKEPPCLDRAQDLITDAIAATRWHFKTTPPEGMITFIDRKKVRPIMVRGVKTWGWTWIKAGFKYVGDTKGGLAAFHIEPELMPEPQEPLPKKEILCNQ